MEVENSNFYRLSLSPSLVFFSSDYFTFNFTQTENEECLLALKRAPFSTPLGRLGSDQIDINVAGTLSPQLEKVISSNKLHTNDDESLSRKVRSSMQSEYQPFGLRRLLMRKNSYYSFTCREADS